MKHILKYIAAVTLIVGFAFQCASADNISKGQQTAVKTVKKLLGAKRVETFPAYPEAPFYRFITKEGKSGIADQSGNVLLPAEYDYVLYFPAFDGNSVNVYVKDSKDKKTSQTISILTQPSREAIWGISEDNGASVFDMKGNMIANFPNTSATYFGNYLFLSSMSYSVVYEDFAKESYNGMYVVECRNTIYREQGYGHGNLVRSDGTVVIPDMEEMFLYQNNPYVIYKKISDEIINYYGMKVVDNRHYTQAPQSQNFYTFSGKWSDITGDNKFISDIPPVFYGVDCWNGVWKVSDKPAGGVAAVYEPGMTKSALIRDPGEAFFVRRQLDDVLAYYSDEGLDAPWASYYSAAALVDKRYPSQLRFERVVEAMEKGSGLPNNEQGIISDVDVIRKMLNMAINLYAQYINSGETEFLQASRSGKSSAEYNLNQLDEYIVRYNNVRNHAAMVTSQQEAQQAALMSSFLNAFSNSIQALTSSGRKSSSTTSYSTSGASATSAGGGSTSSTSTDNSSRKAFLKGQIADWRNKLKKAERSYEQAMSSGDDTWEKKRVLESKQKTIDECANMIRQYESELNSLK